MTPGSMPLAREIYQEGLDHPAGAARARAAPIDGDVLALILANVRTPDEREGDLDRADRRQPRRRARGCTRSSRRYGARTVAATPRRSQDYTERIMRATIARAARRRLRASRTASTTTASAPTPIAIRVACTIARRRRDGRLHRHRRRRRRAASTPTTPSRCRRRSTRSAASWRGRARQRRRRTAARRCSRRDGTIVNAGRPAAVAGGNVETSQRITDVVLGALAQALPDRMPAASQGTMNNVTLGGRDPRTRPAVRLLRDDRRRHGRAARPRRASAACTRT